MLYRVFYSWQSDKQEVSQKIEEALRNKFKKMSKRGIDIELVKATDGASGSRILEEMILENIKKCDFFIADLTPVTKFTTADGKTKLIPNPNCILEFGYALRHFSPECVIAYIQLEDGDNHHELPFDLNHRTYNHFKSGDNVKIDEKELLRIIDIVNKNVSAAIPDYNCSLIFENGCDSTIIEPVFRKVYYYEPEPNRKPENEKIAISKAGANLLSGTPLLDIIHSNMIMRENLVKSASIKIVKGQINRSMIPVKFYLHNLGKALDNCKISLWPVTEGVKFYKSNEKKSGFDINILSVHDLYIDDDHLSAYKNFTDARNPTTKSLVGEIYLKILPHIQEIKIHWNVTARQLIQPCEGDLTITVMPEYEYESKTSTTKTGEVVEELLEDITD